MSSSTTIIMASLLLSLLPARASAVLLWGTGSSSDGLSIINSETGEHQFVGFFHPDPARFTTSVKLTTRLSDGAIFIRNNTPIADSGLAVVDPVTALATHLFGGPIGAIAFWGNDILYTHMNPGGANPSGPIGWIDLNIGAVTSIGGPSLPELSGLAFSGANGLLYGTTVFSFTEGQSLLTIDPATGNLLDSVAVSGAGGTGISDLVFDSDGNAIVCASGAIRDLDVETGKASNLRGYTPIATFQGIGLRIPEPGGVALVTVSLLVFGLKRNRRTRRG